MFFNTGAGFRGYLNSDNVTMSFFCHPELRFDNVFILTNCNPFNSLANTAESV